MSDVMVAFFNAVKVRCSSTYSREQKATEVQLKAEALLDMFVCFEGKESVNYYLHSAFHHLPDQIRQCPIEIDDASGCCIEHAHQSVKRAIQ